MTREQTQPYLDRMRTFVKGEVFPGRDRDSEPRPHARAIRRF